MRRSGKSLCLSLLAAVIGCAAHRDADEPEKLGGSDAAVGDGFNLEDTPTGLDVPVDTATPENCRIATLGIPGDAGSGDIFAKWLDKSGAKAAASLKDQVLTASLLKPYKMIVVQNVSGNHAYGADEVKALSDWVKAGGGLMTLTGFAGPDEIINVNALLAAYDVGYDATPILFGGGKTVPVDSWTSHPVTKGVTRIGIDNGYPVKGTGSKVARGGGYEVLEVRDVGSGHVLVWGDEWITFNSEWSAHPDYQVQTFWQNIVDWFAPGANCKVPDPPK